MKRNDFYVAMIAIALISLIVIPFMISYTRTASARLCFLDIKEAIDDYVKSNLGSEKKEDELLLLHTIVTQINKHKYIGGRGKQITSLFPKLTIKKKYTSYWKYEIEAGLAGEDFGRKIEFCIIAKQKDKKDADARYILFSSKGTDEVGWEWEGSVNMVNYDDSSKTPVQGGYCNPDGSFNPNFK